MKLVFIFGDSAVGKMTVGQELAKVTPLRLFHNHLMIEPVLEVFGQFRSDVIQRLRNVIFEEFGKTESYGLIFTYMMAFDMPSEYEYIQQVKDTLGVKEKDVFYVELIAPQSIRLERNATENRLKHKASKRDLDASNARLIRDDAQHRMVSLPGEMPAQNYLRIENANISAADAAQIIKTHFQLSDT